MIKADNHHISICGAIPLHAEVGRDALQKAPQQKA